MTAATGAQHDKLIVKSGQELGRGVSRSKDIISEISSYKTDKRDTQDLNARKSLLGDY